MVSRITITLECDERAALARLAMSERREPRKQAAVLVAEGLVAHGYLKQNCLCAQEIEMAFDEGESFNTAEMREKIMSVVRMSK